MHDLTIGWDDILRRLHPDSLVGALVYLLITVLIAQLLSRALRIAVGGAVLRHTHIDRTTNGYPQRARQQLRDQHGYQ